MGLHPGHGEYAQHIILSEILDLITFNFICILITIVSFKQTYCLLIFINTINVIYLDENIYSINKDGELLKFRLPMKKNEIKPKREKTIKTFDVRICLFLF